MDRLPSPSSESGFSLVEIMIAMVIFLIASMGVGYSLIQSERQMDTAEHILNGQQYGMASSVSNGHLPTNDFQIGITGAAQSVVSLPVTLTLNPAQPTQACSPGLVNGLMQAVGNILTQLSCIFGGCQNNTPATPTATSYTVSVPATAITTSSSQIAWWNP